MISRKDKEVTDELMGLTKNKSELNKTKKKIRFALISIMILNFVAGIFISSIYFVIREIVFLIIGGVVMLLAIPLIVVLKRFEKKISLLGNDTQ